MNAYLLPIVDGRFPSPRSLWAEGKTQRRGHGGRPCSAC